jgi:hypothetical protein
LLGRDGEDRGDEDDDRDGRDRGEMRPPCPPHEREPTFAQTLFGAGR